MQLPYGVAEYEALGDAPPRGRVERITERENARAYAICRLSGAD